MSAPDRAIAPAKDTLASAQGRGPLPGLVPATFSELTCSIVAGWSASRHVPNCKRLGIPIVKVGRLNLARVVDLVAAIERAASAPRGGDDGDDADRVLGELGYRRRG